MQLCVVGTLADPRVSESSCLGIWRRLACRATRDSHHVAVVLVTWVKVVLWLKQVPSVACNDC